MDIIVTQIQPPTSPDIQSVRWSYPLPDGDSPGTLVLDKPQPYDAGFCQGTGVFHHKHEVVLTEKSPSGRLRRLKRSRQECHWWIFEAPVGKFNLEIELTGQPTDRFGGRHY
jgi:hypothetical protein